jgi:hypothetical protein
VALRQIPEKHADHAALLDEGSIPQTTLPAHTVWRYGAQGTGARGVAAERRAHAFDYIATYSGYVA